MTTTHGCIFAERISGNNVNIAITDENELEAAAKQLLQEFPHVRAFAFHGEMGAGKTTFIKAICKQLGVSEVMSSPTFSIVNEYATETGDTIFHFDFYRLEVEAEAYEAGLHEYFDSGKYCFVEWPEKVPSILPVGTVHLRITIEKEKRIIRSVE